MNIKISFPAFVAAALFVVSAQPVLAQSEKEERSSEKMYKRKYYTGKDADRYRAMDDVKYPEGRKSRKHKDDEGVAGQRHEHEPQAMREDEGRGNDRPAARGEQEESRPTEGRRTHDRDARPVAEEREETHTHSRDAGDGERHSRRSEERGSRKEMRRRAREEKWNK
ncbi:hypothetical protein GCM10023093_02140 [Nemorincola caseinilytica]|uniref:Secreted protein n=1 Tax=Nemorincola caseinilytica TaxID=2054315 RepID=A0ABP8N5Z4_9BACT